MELRPRVVTTSAKLREAAEKLVAGGFHANLREACKAAELYVRSGHAEHEHSLLIKCLAAARGSQEAVAV